MKVVYQEEKAFTIRQAREFAKRHSLITKEFVSYPYCAVEVTVVLRIENSGAYHFMGAGVAKCHRDRWNPGNILEDGLAGLPIAKGKAEKSVAMDILLCIQSLIEEGVALPESIEEALKA